MDEEYCIEVTDVHKKYFNLTSSEQLLRGLTLKVPKGCMYGLLGPSGCGKTTLLKCILGKSNIDNGVIRLSIDQWKQIGYMPQSVSLHEEFSIKELFLFYGKIHEIESQKLRSKINELSDLLELPPLDRNIVKCSGGEQRRISLAVTLLHDPDILLLDEPTVGLDPLLAYKITNYLKELTEKYGKTILITTHYMEEARSLDIVAFMRNGVILYEGPPESIITQYGCTSLDDVFVHLITNNNIGDDYRKNKTVTIKEPVKIIPQLKNRSNFSRNHLKAQVYKNYKWTLGNIPMTLVIFAIPVTCVLLFNLLFSKVNLQVGYFNEEILYENGNCFNKSILLANDCPPTNFYSCQYLELLSQKLSLREFSSIKDGIESIKNGDTYAFIHFPTNFSTSIASRISFRIVEIQESLDDRQLQVWMDNTLYVEAVDTREYLHKTLLKLVENTCEECGIDIRLAKAFVTIKKMPIIYGENMKRETRTYPYLIISNMMLMCYIYAASMISLEKISGTLERVEISGLTTAEILIGNFISQFLMMNLQNVATMLATYPLLNEPCYGSYSLVYFIIILNGILGCLTGLLVTCFTSSAYPIGYIGTGMMLSITTINGSVWPTEGMHWTVKLMSDFNAVVMSSNSYANIAFRGYSLSHPLVYPGVISIILSCIGTIVLIHLKIKFSKKV